MRTIMIMFDTLTRKFLPNYGNGRVIAPNFRRLERRCTRFDAAYGGSMPCMPARRELHTGKYNFLYRSWGPLEPFDRSVMEILGQNGIYTHLITDHSHYWEDGGATYHNRYSSWEGFRGQEGDRCVPRDVAADIPQRHELNKQGVSVRQHYRNRIRQQTAGDMPSRKVFAAGLEFLREHEALDNWFLQLEAFDPHEPFYVPQKYRDLYGLPAEETLNWPRYGIVASDDYRSDIDHARKEYAALLTMCDESLGFILDFMDGHDMWKDTALIINTDHGFLLGEHECLGKNFPPMYDELIHLPLFIHLPGETTPSVTDGLAAAVDLAPTLLDIYGMDAALLGDIDGRSLLPLLRQGTPVRPRTLFGVHGSSIGCTDGRMVYIKANAAPDNNPLYEYTLMPTNIRGFFSHEQLAAAELVPGSRFTNGIPCLRFPGVPLYHAEKFGDLLFDTEADPEENHNLLTPENAPRWNRWLVDAMREADAPAEEYMRLGLVL